MTASQMNSSSGISMVWERSPKIYIVENDSSSRASIESYLRRQGITVQSFRDGEEFLKAAAHDEPEIVLLNIRLPGIGGIETVSRFKKIHPDTSIIFLSVEDSADICAQAERLGAYDIILTPFQKTRLNTAIRNALQKRDLVKEMKNLKSELRLRYDFSSITGSTPGIIRMVGTLKRLAASDVPVLLHGGKGSGKELAARTLHYNSRFADGPFICINCSVLRTDLLGSDVFNSLRGNSVIRDGATQEKWMRAKGGTLFLDDITDLELSLMNKLLNRLKSCGNFQTGEDGAPIDFRIICGTREDIGMGGTNLKEHSEFFRLLAPFQVKIPSLRNRADDIPILIKRFLNDILPAHRSIPNITPEAMRLLKTYSWPGNIRELKNVISQTFLLNDSDRIGPEDLPPSIRNFKAAAPPSDPQKGPPADSDSADRSGWDPNEVDADIFSQEDYSMNENSEEKAAADTGRQKDKPPFPTIRESERRLILEALEFTNWNMKRTASLLEISRPALYRRIEKLRISRNNPPAAPPEKGGPSPSSGSDVPPTIKTEGMAGVPSCYV